MTIPGVIVPLASPRRWPPSWGADVQPAIGEQTILFTDMIGSTAMYRERRDPAAFVEVKRHFKGVFAVIAKHRGAVVKTIGDAAIGAFNDPLDAVKASKAIQDQVYDRRADTQARLRISLDTGPCIAVRSTPTSTTSATR